LGGLSNDESNARRRGELTHNDTRKNFFILNTDDIVMNFLRYFSILTQMMSQERSKSNIKCKHKPLSNGLYDV
jgi:hypothetical protein